MIQFTRRKAQVGLPLLHGGVYAADGLWTTALLVAAATAVLLAVVLAVAFDEAPR